uniref:Mitochondrial import inner membrane translocase subunit TIM50 n=1 Tax=Parastrongyloides trichosuri TaxID=131310 RepID=A0A0N4ZYA4_PARTI
MICNFFTSTVRNAVLISRFSTISSRRFLTTTQIMFDKKLNNDFVSCLDKPKVVSPFANNYSTINDADHNRSTNKTFNERKVQSSLNQVSPLDGVEKLKKENVVNTEKPNFESSHDEKVNHEEISEKEIEEKRQRQAKNTMLGMKILFGSSLVGLVCFAIYSSMEQRDESGNVIKDKYSGQILAPLWRLLDSLNNVKKIAFEPSREKLLPDPLQYPYLQPKYTLVIEMKNILLHPEWTYKTGYRFKKRPAIEYFLDVVGYPNFEVVIYTSESNISAPPILDQLDPNQKIMYRLYRDCTLYEDGHNRKDLSRLNRDLSKVIYIDYDPESFKLHPENVLRVPKWEGDMEDTSLIDLAELLKTILESDVDDVRPTLQYYSQYDDPAKEFKRRAYYLAQQKAESQSQEKESTYGALKRYSGTLFGFKRHN